MRKGKEEGKRKERGRKEKMELQFMLQFVII